MFPSVLRGADLGGASKQTVEKSDAISRTPDGFEVVTFKCRDQRAIAHKEIELRAACTYEDSKGLCRDKVYEAI
jgi:hypothetical protein